MFHYRGSSAPLILAELRAACGKLAAAGVAHVPRDLGECITQQPAHRSADAEGERIEPWLSRAAAGREGACA